MKTDGLFYLLFQSVPGILLELIGKPYGSDYEYQAVNFNRARTGSRASQSSHRTSKKRR